MRGICVQLLWKSPLPLKGFGNAYLGFCMAMCCFNKGKLTWLLEDFSSFLHEFGIGINKHFGSVLVIYVVGATIPACFLGLRDRGIHMHFFILFFECF